MKVLKFKDDIFLAFWTFDSTFCPNSYGPCRQCAFWELCRKLYNRQSKRKL